MKIVSPFRDYYDGIQAYGHDADRVYHRETCIKVYIPESWPYSGDILSAFELLPIAEGDWHGTIMEPALLLFAGESLPVWYWPNYNTKGEFNRSESLLATGGVYEKWHAHYSALEERSDDFRQFFHSKEWTKHDHQLIVPEEQMRVALEDQTPRDLGIDLLVGERVPVALICAGHRHTGKLGEVTMIVNPPLAPLGFGKVKDAFSAYQSIETFLGSALAEPDLAPQRVGSDEILAAQKGFDAMSFRTAAPGVKKTNCAANRRRKRGDPPDLTED